MKPKIIFLTVCALLLMSVALAGAQDANTLIIAGSADPTTFNPVYQVQTIGSQIAGMIYDPLYRYDPFSGIPIPHLASWEISEDGLTYTFTIRDDVFWSDGTPLTANDAVFTLNAIQADIAASPRKAITAGITNIEVLDEKTFRFTTPSVNCETLNNMIGAVPLPSHLYAPDFSDVENSPLNTEPTVSSGPYLFDERQRDEFIRLVANPNYWQGPPSIGAVVIKVLPEAPLRIQSMLAGESDYMSGRTDDLEQFTSLDDFNVFSFPTSSVEVFAMNWADPANPLPAFDENGDPVEQPPHPIFGDVRVRQAVAMGYSKQALLDSLGENGGYLMAGPVAPQIAWAYDDSIEPWPYDPEAAAALLDEAGWTDQDGDGIRECNGCLYAEEGTPLAFSIDYTAMSAIYENNAVIAQDQLSQLGMDITLNSMEFGTLINESIFPQTFDALVINFDPQSPSANAVPSIYMTRRSDVPGSGINFTSYANAEFDALVEQVRTTPGCDPEVLRPLLSQIQRIAHDDVAYDFTITSNFIHIMNKRVVGFDPGPWSIFYNIHEWSIAQ